MLVSGAWGARNQHFKISGFFLAAAALFFAIFGRASGQIYEKIPKNRPKIAFMGRPGQEQNAEAWGCQICAMESCAVLH